ncbi:biliverdin-producing heme oxygenase [Legionella maioricensis]|uniref:Biliverdin-producing heme oxygenase n=1 Tax=Legionella maioricensis TaxID=2896528 RepID=A0A9X2D2N6_9GAMM|nr:biliverdin-producing heme oxygenase [Legionella maioricensis]MCL9685128.1 biliverdin-producing heme oxygenase [Legionella maioricensis]MCL9688359.1 biliverdin-producing heme oxygenase [Legionella maioricensis]
MFSYRSALLNATYKEGQVGKLTDEHEQAEHHRFKKDFLFKNKQIPKDLYVARLIQHFLIIKAIETQLQKLDSEKSEINAFFALSYIEHLWRTPGIQKDLQQLGINPDQIKESEIAPTTKRYLKDIEQFTPKVLLGHFLVHVAGFMHGGNIIRSKFIEPSNSVTDYQISTHQYDFSSAATFLQGGKGSSFAVYQDMMNKMDEIALDSDEYEEILKQGKSVYAIMTSLYDDLCEMHTNHPTYDLAARHADKPTTSCYSLAVISVSMLAIAYIVTLLADFSMNSGMSPRPS